ncbi:MAG TPA: STAS domain-containing protein [Acidimicrobiales bacterium]|nr:STAS domain-containing protein [Acidimicrobiales bacterium]
MTIEPSIVHAQFDRAGRHLTVYLAGELDTSSAGAVGDEILSHHQPDDERVWLDVSAVSFCDSSGLGMFFRLHQAVEEHGGRLVVYNPQVAVRRVIDLTDRSGVLQVQGRPG